MLFYLFIFYLYHFILILFTNVLKLLGLVQWSKTEAAARRTELASFAPMSRKTFLSAGTNFSRTIIWAENNRWSQPINASRWIWQMTEILFCSDFRTNKLFGRPTLQARMHLRWKPNQIDFETLKLASLGNIQWTLLNVISLVLIKTENINRMNLNNEQTPCIKMTL